MGHIFSFQKGGIHLLSNISRKYRETALIKLIAVGLIIGILIAL